MMKKKILNNFCTYFTAFKIVEIETYKGINFDRF